MTEPKLSILIPAYNAGKTIAKAIESVPKRDDIEILVYDDGSKDNTREEATEGLLASGLNGRIIGDYDNHGVAYAVNRLLGEAEGEWLVLLGSDDWLITDACETVMDMLKPTLDLVYFNLETNNGSIYRLREESKFFYCGSVKFMRRAFVGDTRLNESKKAGEDWYFFNELQAKKPREAFSGITAKHYNYPRKGSLSDRRKNGEFTKDEV